MSESSSMSNRFPGMPSPGDGRNMHLRPSSSSDGASRKKTQQLQQRQLLSCTKCRQRKVKCDRTKPCMACCARGQPRECHFLAEEGDYAPISQSYELKKLRAEIHRLKERLRAGKISSEDEEGAHSASAESQAADKSLTTKHRYRNKQKRFRGSEWSDSIYFGSPGLANVLSEFANINLTSPAQSLAHLIPRGPEIHIPRDPPPYPFATLFPPTPSTCIPALLGCLPPRKELEVYVEAFEKRVAVFAFPHVPVQIKKDEVERYLSDPKNAEAYPDILGLLFAALALGSQHSVWDRSGGSWVAGEMAKELKKGDVYIAAAKQALRLACFTSRPTLIGIQALVMIGPYLTNSGRFLDAWTLFGTTVRLAQAIGLHRHPQHLNPAPPTQRECSVRQQLWWWMLHMDQQYSMTLGRPLGISGMGDCLPPHELAINTTHLRFGESVHRFTVLARQILGSRLSNAKIDGLSDSLVGLLETLPDVLQFNESWLTGETEIPDWPWGPMAAAFYCQTHSYLILLNRQRLDQQNLDPLLPNPTTSASAHSLPSFAAAVGTSSPAHSSPSAPPKVALRGRRLVLASSVDVLTAYLFFYARFPAALVSWTMAQLAFNSSMILILDALETGDLSRIGKVEKTYAVFVELDKKEMHQLAALAVQRISRGLTELKRMEERFQAGSNVESDESSGREGQPERTYAIRVRSEAKRGFKVAQDTVMGNTGTMLLEDGGLQSFAPAAFTPLDWSADQEEWAAARLARGKEGERGGMEWSWSRDEGADSKQDRSAGQVSEGQPQGLTPPTSPLSSGTLGHDPYQHTIQRRNTFPAASFQDAMGDAAASQHATQTRHDPDGAPDALYSDAFTQFSWPVRPAPLLSAISDPVLGYPHVSSATQALPGSGQPFPHPAPYPVQLSLVGSEGESRATDLTWTAGEHLMAMESWTGWPGGSQAG
ncbi:hypothetical protein EJ04DRAFT_136883 [Polyplosphaeria fusca]|uniref:Zn(2)-C6 fungal-type domain-containing protein n=1 Tax=Polyplosphaeria fusca TaxID=682080 RepID=A0A9P4UWS8_9PLEO|nr:hypothetical protein EJ04DRAFT_136883 [Polyplosphaeria fusca]